jgi:type IV pilus assembly protein PilC
MAKQRKLSSEELAAFCSQFAMLTHAAITPLESIRILLSDTKDEGARALLLSLNESISNGDSLYEAMEKTGVFPPYVLNTIKLGEQSGSTDDILNSLAKYYEREVSIKESIKSAITYPVVMIFMMVIVILVLITKVLPIFNQVFIQLGSEMTGFASSLLKMGNGLNTYSLGIIIFLVLCLGLYIFFSKTGAGKKAGMKFLAWFFLTKSFYEDVAIQRFAGGMSLVLRAGLDTYKGLDMVKELVEHKKTQARIDVCRQSIKEQASFPEAIKEAGFFTNLNNRLIEVGFRSGQGDEVMNKIADEYSEKSEKKMNEIISVIEPTLVIILSVIVGLILLSVILPLMGILSNIG